MRRSAINQLMEEALELFSQHRFALPRWATWSPDTWAATPDLALYAAQHQMGWDITDFGSKDFEKRGLILFCIRNGLAGEKHSKPYAEKIMIVRQEQETPLHFHKTKMEDIINRGGGKLVLEMFQAGPGGEKLDHPVEVRVDGRLCRCEAGAPLVLEVGESITIPRGLYHRFYGQKGTGTTVVGEVSQVNDDYNDNFFFEPLGRFSKIEEDVPALYPLWNELITPEIQATPATRQEARA